MNMITKHQTTSLCTCILFRIHSRQSTMYGLIRGPATCISRILQVYIYTNWMFLQSNFRLDVPQESYLHWFCLYREGDHQCSTDRWCVDSIWNQLIMLGLATLQSQLRGNKNERSLLWQILSLLLILYQNDLPARLTSDIFWCMIWVVLLGSFLVGANWHFTTIFSSFRCIIIGITVSLPK